MNKKFFTFNKKLNTFFAAVIALSFLFSSFSASVFADNTQNTQTESAATSSNEEEELVFGRLSHLVTTNNPDNYAVIDTEGDKITVRGKFTSDNPFMIDIFDTSCQSNDFKREGGGAFSGELICKPLENGYYNFYIGFDSKLAMTYLLKYDEKGWHIPDNNLNAKNAEKLKHIREADPMAAAYYISPTADKQQIKDTMEKIEAIAHQVCDGVEDDYQKAYLLNRWIADNIYYDHDAAETEVTIETVALCNVLDLHRTTCAGYANLLCALLEVEGIRSVNLKGAAVAGDITYETLTTGGENHEFSAFWYEKQQRWVYADACWSGAGDYKNGKYENNTTYDKYFDVTGEAFSLNHRIDKVEERHYTKALEALEQQTAAVSSDNTETADTTPSSETAEITENTSKPTITAEPVTKDSSNEQNPSNPNNDKKEDGFNTVLCVIICVIGAFIIVLGVILAVKRKKAKNDGN